MGKHDYHELEFTHFVAFTADGSVFGCAKRNGHIYNFLIRRDGVHRQQGMGWQKLDRELARIVHNRIQRASGVPTFKTDRLPVR